MAKIVFHQLDVFTDRALGGNPLAIFPSPELLTDSQMQGLARETNLSETTFITARDPENQRYSVRIFTPDREVPFAGHPTIGTAWLLFQNAHAATAELTLELKAGDVPVRIDRSYERPLVHFTPPPVNMETAVTNTSLLCQLFGLKEDDFELDAAPAQLVSAGLRFLIVPVRHRGALERIETSVPAIKELARVYDCDLLTAFIREGYAEGSQFATRVFAPLHGVPEDPATGSSASCLAAYLRHHRLIKDCGEKWLKLDQGYSVRRPGVLWLRANMDPQTQRVEVGIGGQVVPVAVGTFEI